AGCRIDYSDKHLIRKAHAICGVRARFGSWRANCLCGGSQIQSQKRLAYNSRTEVQKDKRPPGRRPLKRTPRSWRCRSIGLLIRRVRVCEPTPTEERKPAWRAVAAPLGGGKRGSGECHRLRNALAQ